MATTTQVETINAIGVIGARTDFAGSPATDVNPEDLRLFLAAFDEGIVKPEEAFQVVAGSAATMNVLVGSGTSKADYAIVEGQITGMGNYAVRLDQAQETITLDAANVSNPRIDEIYLVVLDDTYDSGGQSLPILAVRKGDAAASPALPGPDGAWDAYLKLAEVLIPASAADITECTITDSRVAASLVSAVQDQSFSSFFPFAIEEEVIDAYAGAEAVTGSFQTKLTKSFTPPSHWNTYTLVAEMHLALQRDTSAGGYGEATARIQIGGNTGTEHGFRVDATSPGAHVSVTPWASHIRTNLSGSVTVNGQFKATSGYVFYRQGILLIRAYRTS